MTGAGTRRRSVLIGGAGLMVAAGSRPAAAQAGTTDYAVFSEFSPGNKQMKAGWNRRFFTDTDVRKGNAIQYDLATGIATLAAGTYHLSGFSTVAYTSGGEPPEMTTIRAPASAGYCRLRKVAAGDTTDPVDMRAIDNGDPGVLCIGSASNANMTPSLFETFFEAASPANLVLEHQCGSNPEQIYLRVFTQNSKWHASARISIRRLG